MNTKTLKLNKMMREEIAIDFENYEEHYEILNCPEMIAEKVLFEKLKKGENVFTYPEILMIGETLSNLSEKDMFFNVYSYRKQLYKVEIEIGKWTPITDEEASEQIANSCGMTVDDFPKVDGIRYDFNSNWEELYKEA